MKELIELQLDMRNILLDFKSELFPELKSTLRQKSGLGFCQYDPMLVEGLLIFYFVLSVVLIVIAIFLFLSNILEKRQLIYFEKLEKIRLNGVDKSQF
jgi:hypothetical protein